MKTRSTIDRALPGQRAVERRLGGPLRSPVSLHYLAATPLEPASLLAYGVGARLLTQLVKLRSVLGRQLFQRGDHLWASVDDERHDGPTIAHKPLQRSINDLPRVLDQHRPRPDIGRLT